MQEREFVHLNFANQIQTIIMQRDEWWLELAHNDLPVSALHVPLVASFKPVFHRVLEDESCLVGSRFTFGFLLLSFLQLMWAVVVAFIGLSCRAGQ